MKQLLLVSGFFVPLLYAIEATAHDEHQSSLAPHEHGKLTMNVAFDKNILELELDGPAASITGFEYMPTGEADRNIASLAKQQLSNPLHLFAVAASAECELTEKTIRASIFGDKAEPEKHEHEQADHDEHHHSDIEAHYSLTCKQPTALQQLDFSNFFKTFPLTKQINLQYIGANVQKGETLTPNNTQFKLSH